jgi:biotin operon repressor
VQVVTDSSQLATLLSPVRMRVLEGMTEPQSATTLAPRLGMSRQKLNYHLRELEREGFLEVVEHRQRRGCIERVMKVTSRAFVVNPALLGSLAVDPEQVRDRFSSGYLLAAATRLMGDVSLLRERAAAVNQKLATFTMETDIRFASPAAFRSFTEELAGALGTLAAKYDRPSAKLSRRFRVAVGSYPAVTKTPREAAAEATTHQRRQRRNSARRVR